MSELTATCPAATAIDGPPARGPSVICGVMANEREREIGRPLASGATTQRNEQGGVLVTAADDPSSLRAFCCHRYTSCPIWRAERERAWAAKRSILKLPDA